MKTAELTGAQLDYWVAKALGFAGRDLLEVGETGGWHLPCDISTLYGGSGTNQVWFSVWRPSTQWSQGGPIIEHGRIGLQPHMPRSGNSLGWEASEGGLFGWEEEGISGVGVATGPTPLIAAMRAKVASVYGEEVPDA